VQLEVPSEGHPLVAEVRAAQEEVLRRLRGVEGASTMPGRVFIRWAACQAVQEVPVSGAERQSWTCNTTDEEMGREERRGSVQAGKEGRSRGERGGEAGQGWPTGCGR
jgi:hypothetical protein